MCSAQRHVGGHEGDGHFCCSFLYSTLISNSVVWKLPMPWN